MPKHYETDVDDDEDDDNYCQEQGIRRTYCRQIIGKVKKIESFGRRTVVFDRKTTKQQNNNNNNKH